MPKKRNHLKPFRPSLTASSSTSNSAGDKPQKSVNELLANLRRSSINPASAAAGRSALAATAAPSVPPDIRHLLQIPDTPAPQPRRQGRQRFDGNGRRLPAGPPPPRSWVDRQSAVAAVAAVEQEGGGASSSSGKTAAASSSSRLSCRGLAETTLPGSHLPDRGSLIDIVLQKLAYDWEFHRVYNQYHLYFVPNHLKPALIRFIGIASQEGLSLNDLKAILLPPPDTFDDEGEGEAEEGGDGDHASDELGCVTSSCTEVNYLDLSGSIGRSLKLKEVGDLLFPSHHGNSASKQHLQDSWDATDESDMASPPSVLLPNLTHLSLALTPQSAASSSSSVSWKQLLVLAPKLSSLTHLSLAHWPVPCLTPGARLASVVYPQGNSVPYGGTNYYSHTLDQDWSEALLVLRKLSRSLYALEFLDLTGCAPWFRALTASSGHDFVDWAGSWGKITNLRLLTGWKPGEDASLSQKMAYREGSEMARSVERHIVAMRQGKGRIINVERDRLDI